MSAVRVAVAAIPDIKLVLGVPSLFLLADAMQSFASNSRLVLDLSPSFPIRGHCDLTAFHVGHSLWAILVQRSELDLNLQRMGVRDDVIAGMAHAIEASLLTDRPVAWRIVKLGLAYNPISEAGIWLLMQSLGRCPHLVDLTIDLGYNEYTRDPVKLDAIMHALGHIPSLHIALDHYSDLCGRISKCHHS